MPKMPSAALLSWRRFGWTQGNQSDCMKESVNRWLARKASSAIAFQASLKAAIFSVPIRRSSLRSRAEGDAPAMAMRATRWAMTCGTATPSSIVCTASDFDLRGRRVAMVFLII